MSGSRPDKNLNCGYLITFSKQTRNHELRLHGNYLGAYKSKKACEIVKGIHKREEAIKNLKRKLLDDDQYQLEQYYKSLENNNEK